MIPLASRKRYSSQKLQSIYRDVTKPLRIKTEVKDPRAFLPNKRVTYGQLFGFGDRAHQYLPRGKPPTDNEPPPVPANRIQHRHLLIIRAVLEKLNVFPGDPPEFGEQPVSWKDFLKYALAAVKEQPIPKPKEPAPPAGGPQEDASTETKPESDGRPGNEITAGDPARLYQDTDQPLVPQSPLINFSEDKGNPVSPTVRRLLRQILYVMAGAVVGLLGQGFIVAVNYWLTGLPLESIVGLSGAHVIPVISAFVGALGGFVLLAYRAQRCDNTITSQL